MLAKEIKHGAIVELGSYLGKSASVFAAMSGKDTVIYCIDLWNNCAMPGGVLDTYTEFLKNIEPWKDRIIPIRANTHDEKFQTIPAIDFSEGMLEIDLLFIDGDHSYEGCLADLKCWYSRVKPGAKIVLHDYTETAPGCGVKQAADEFFSNFKPKESRISCSLLVVTIGKSGRKNDRIYNKTQILF